MLDASDRPAGEWPNIRDVLELGLNTALFDPARPVYDQVVADLNAIPTRDPKLKSARAVWRMWQARLAKLSPFQPYCAQLEAWRQAGWPPEQQPRASRDFNMAMQGLLQGHGYPKLLAAEARLRQLGVSKRAAARVLGDTLLQTPEDRLAAALGEE